jgi:hypothetical protein
MPSTNTLIWSLGIVAAALVTALFANACTSSIETPDKTDQKRLPARTAPAPPEKRLTEKSDGNLRMVLAIQNDYADGLGRHAVRIDIQNIGKDTVTLVDRHDRRFARDTALEEILQPRVQFLSIPRVPVPSGQFAEPLPRKMIRYERRLAPGQQLTLEWLTVGDSFAKTQSPDNKWMYPVFPMPGQYAVQAHLIVQTKERPEGVSLSSNPQPFVVGGSLALPKALEMTIVATAPDQNTVTLDASSDFGVSVDEIYILGRTKGKLIPLRIVRVGESSCDAIVEARTGDDVSDRELAFPVPGDIATHASAR